MPGEGEVVGDVQDRRVEILCDRDELVVTWTRFGPHRDGASPHIHRTHTDLFFVLAGELTVFVGAGAGGARPPGGVARVRAAVRSSTASGTRADGELRYLNFHAPSGGFADYLRGATRLRPEDPPADGGLPVTERDRRPAGAGRLLIDRDEIRIEVRDEPGPASDRLTCLYALEDGRSSRSGRKLDAWTRGSATTSSSTTSAPSTTTSRRRR